jgi:tetratricopeptide (TPR) repeat protein
MITVALNRCLCWTMLTLMLSTAESSKKQMKVHELYIQGKTAYDKHDYDASILACDKMLELDSKHFASFIRRGGAYEMKRDVERAMADYGEAIRLISEELRSYDVRGFIVTLANYPMVRYNRQLLVGAYSRRAAIYAQKHDYDHAVDDLAKAISLDPKDAFLYRQRASVYSAQKDFKRAKADCDKLVELTPSQADSYEYRGGLSLDAADYEHALEDFNEAIRLNPQDATAYYCRGIVYQSMTEYERALADLEESARIDPQHYYACLALAHRLLKRPQQDLRDHQKALDCGSTGYWAIGKTSPEEYEITTSSFTMPLRITYKQPEKIVSLRLLLSEDKGKTWKHVKDYKPSDERVFFTAPRDGSYWFSIQATIKDGDSERASSEIPSHTMKVYVNTKGTPHKAEKTNEEPQAEVERLRMTVQNLEKKIKELESNHNPR